MKKLMLGAVPLMAAMAFAVMPAMASAATLQYGTCAATKTGEKETKPPCKAKETFHPFTAATKVTDSKVSTSFVLEGENEKKEKSGITCTTFSSKGTYSNKENAKKELVGESVDELTFDGCTGTGGLAGCEINPPSHEITGTVDDIVLSETEVEIKIVSGFNVKCGTTELGNVTGTAKGKVSGDETTFTKASGLTFAGLPSTITGTLATVTEVGKLPVFIN